MSPEQKYTPTEILSVINQTLDYAYPSVIVEGEVASFKVNQGKWVFFDLKDEMSCVNCFMVLSQLNFPLEDGMKIRIRGIPKLTKFGKFSFTVRAVQPVGEGSLKKAFEKLKKQLAAEGLFDRAKKRPLPKNLSKIGVISSTNAAGYADFIKIINARWGGLKIQTAHTQVQGLDAPAQIIRALNYFNEHSEVEVIAILRGGGSADDLAAFNDEQLVRAIAASKIPVITGIGHEVDESLADLAADVRASTPSNAAEMLSKDRQAEIRRIHQQISGVYANTISYIDNVLERQTNLSDLKRFLIAKIDQASLNSRPERLNQIKNVILNDINNLRLTTVNDLEKIRHELKTKITLLTEKINHQLKILEILNPEKILKQGYAILSGKISPGNIVKITTSTKNINAEIKEIYDRK